MGLPVNTVATGGLPVVESTNGFGTPVTEAAAGRGVAVTKVVGKPGLPVIFESIGLAAGPPLDGLSPTFAGSMSRDLLTSFIGSSRYTNVSGDISSFTDQTGNARHFSSGTAGARPTVSTAGSLNRACANFDGTNDALTGSPWQSCMTPTSKFIVVSAIVDVVSSATDTNYYSSGHWLIGDDNGLVMLNASVDASTKKMYAAQYTGSFVERIGTPITEGTPYVFSLRHQSGTWYFGVNGVETSITGSTTYTISNAALRLGFRSTAGYLDGKIFEVVIFSAVPTAPQCAALIADMMAHIGA